MTLTSNFKKTLFYSALAITGGVLVTIASTQNTNETISLDNSETSISVESTNNIIGTDDNNIIEMNLTNTTRNSLSSFFIEPQEGNNQLTIINPHKNIGNVTFNGDSSNLLTVYGFGLSINNNSTGRNLYHFKDLNNDFFAELYSNPEAFEEILFEDLKTNETAFNRLNDNLFIISDHGPTIKVHDFFSAQTGLESIYMDGEQFLATTLHQIFKEDNTPFLYKYKVSIMISLWIALIGTLILLFRLKKSKDRQKLNYF